MRTTTIGEILDGDVRVEDPEHYLYKFTDNKDVLYIGKSFNLIDRLETHLGQYNGRPASSVGRYILGHLPESKNWVVELPTLQECETLTIEYMRNSGVVWYSSEIYNNPMLIEGAVDFAETALISEYKPLLNVAKTEFVNKKIVFGNPDDSSGLKLVI